MNNDLPKTSDWIFQWRIKFTQDPREQSEEVITI